MIVKEVLSFWFSDEMRSRWFASTPELDQEIKRRFEAHWQAAVAGQLNDWKHSAEGSLALVIVLDQFPLNMYRGQAKSFSSEAQAIEVAAQAVSHAQDHILEAEQQAFLYMPFMHSESLKDQDQSVALFNKAGLDHSFRFAKHHRDIIVRFGRFPHRNAILGRTSTDAEIEYLNSKEAFTG